MVRAKVVPCFVGEYVTDVDRTDSAYAESIIRLSVHGGQKIAYPPYARCRSRVNKHGDKICPVQVAGRMGGGQVPLPALQGFQVIGQPAGLGVFRRVINRHGMHMTEIQVQTGIFRGQVHPVDGIFGESFHTAVLVYPRRGFGVIDQHEVDARGFCQGKAVC